MKINIANIFGGIIIALTITSCEDFLSREPIDKVNADTWFSSETDLLLYANGMLQSYLPSESTIGLGDAYCDLVATKTSSDYYRLGVWNSTKQTGWAYSDWENVRRANYMMENMVRSKGKVDDIIYNHYDGVAHFWRAFFYYSKIRTFGDVPWIDKVLEENDPAIYAQRDDRELVMHHVLEDLNFACENLQGSDLRQDPDCLDTWFSSWLWPISLFDGIRNPDNEEIKYYYPTNDLVTGPDIIFFWVARMIMAGYEFMGDMPFRNVYFTGIVRDKIGRKMSKSLGNSPDPIELIDRYGADGVRMGLMLAAPAGNDLQFDEALCEQGRNFNNKIWNAMRLVKGWTVEDKEQSGAAAVAVEWFDSMLSSAVEEMNDLFSKYRISDALLTVYKLFWDEFSSWYLELVKPEYGSSIDRETYECTIAFFEKLCVLLHPFMPFISEEVWHNLKERGENQSIMTASWPEAGKTDNALLKAFDQVKMLTSAIRTIRVQKNIPNKESLVLHPESETHDAKFNPALEKMCKLQPISSSEGKGGSMSVMAGTEKYTLFIGDAVNSEEEIRKAEDEIKYLEGFLASVMKKLSNEKFVQNAKPEVVENERKKKADAESKIATLRASISELKGGN